MKGIALAIETIVFVILAVMVLTVLLFFFTSVAGPTQREFQYQQQSVQACGIYTNVDPQCTVDSGNPNFEKIRTAVGSDPLKKIAEACANLKKSGCTDPNHEATLACIQNCCLSCTSRPV